MVLNMTIADLLKLHLGSIIVGAIILVAVIGIIISIVRKKKKGGCSSCSCGCNCDVCPGETESHT